MEPVLIHLGPLRVRAYGLALAIAFLVGSVWVTRRGRRFGYRDEELSQLFLWILASALVGSRIYYAVQHPSDFSGDWLEVIQIWRGGLTLYGGLIAALLAAWLFVRSRRWSFRTTVDLFAPAVALGEAITRVGCFMNGCCFGCPTNLPWGVTYPEGSATWWQVGAQRLHPAQLYLTVGNVLLALFLGRIGRPMLGAGRVFALYLIVSSVIRFGVDFARFYVETDYLTIAGIHLAHSQWVAILLIVIGVIIWLRPRREVSPPTAIPQD